ncbi:MAG: ATP-binding protein [Verrucomicrobiota bacterium]
MSKSPQTRTVVISFVYILAFFATDKMALAFAIMPGVSLWYPPPGLTLALLLVFGPRWLPLAIVTSTLSGFLVYPMPQVWATCVMALNSTLTYAVIAAGLRAWLGRPPQLGTMASAFGFALVLVFAALPAAWGGTWLLQIVGLAESGDFQRSVFRWWLGDTAGILSLLPVLLIFLTPLHRTPTNPLSTPHVRTRREWLEIAAQALALVASLGALYLLAPLRQNHIPYLSFVPLTWIVLRHGLPGAGLAILGINIGTMYVLKVTGAPEPILISFLLFQFSTTVMGLGLGAMVTSRKRAEAERNRLLEIVEATPDFIGNASLDGRILYCNTAFRRLRGDGAALPGTPIAALHPSWAAEKILHEGIPTALAQGRWSGETALLDSQGREVPVSQVIVPHRDSDGSITALFTVARDISEQKKAEAERLDSERKMLHAQKLESLGVLAGGIAHDFNNLLTSMLGNASLGRLDLPEHSPVQYNLKEIERAALRAAELCQQMLAYAGKGQLELTSLDLTALINSTAHLLQVSIPKKVTLGFALAPHLPAVHGDPTQLRQVVMNLVLNAGEAVGDRPGTIRILSGAMRAEADWLAAGAVTPPPPPGDYVYLDIVDDGRGMSAETRARIFEPFFTTKFAGHGLGLSAVLGIVRSHGGTLRVYSEVEQGTRIRVAFPARHETAATSQRALPLAPGWRGHGTILVVDDEETVRVVTAHVLEHAGFKVEMASNGSEAVERFATDPQRYRAVVLDVVMPVLDGEQALEELRRVRPDIPVLLMSGYSGRSGIAQSGTGRTSFLSKPFESQSLLGALQHLLESPAQ